MAAPDQWIVLSAKESERFAAYLRQDAEQDAHLVAFLADLPSGTNGAHIRTDCKIRRDVKRALADEIEQRAATPGEDTE
jgi:hypothetical protein